MTLYHIGYVEVGNILLLLGIIGVIGCDQVVWWLTSIAIWPILRFMAWVPNTNTLGTIVVMVGKIG
jgi:hypothetical protein